MTPVVKPSGIAYTEDNITLFISKFSTNRYATQEDVTKNGTTAYVPGSKQPLHAELVKSHLDGKLTLGSYCITPTNECLFLVIDCDIDTMVAKKIVINKGGAVSKKDREAYDEAMKTMQGNVRNIITGLTDKLGFERNQLLIERSGVKGYHIWMFFEDRVPALEAYKLTRIIARELDIAGYEIYPRQPAADDNRVGSLIKIPLGINRKNGARCLFLDDSFEPFMDQWSALGAIKPVSKEKLANITKLQDNEVENVEQDTIEDLTSIGGSIDRMIERCDVLKEMKFRAEGSKDGDSINFTHDERLMLLSLFRKFGNIGKTKLHQFLRNTHNYDHDKTDKIFGSANTTKPMCCSTLRERGICQKECQGIIDEGGKSPIKLAMDKSKASMSATILHTLGEIENPVLNGRRVRVDFIASAILDTPYYSAKKVTYKVCTEGSCPEYGECTAEKRDQAKVQTLGHNKKEHIDVHGMNDRQVQALTKAKVEGCIAPKYLQRLETLEDYLVQPFVASNIYDAALLAIIGAEGQRNPDEKVVCAKENKDYLMYYLNSDLEGSKAYRGYGTVMRHPHNQCLTILFDKVDPVAGQVDDFVVGETNRHIFEQLKQLTVADWVEDFRERIACIYARDLLIFSVLLVHFSVRELVFNKTKLNRGWMELILVGDSGTAKTKLTGKIIEYIGLGKMEGANCSAAGLLGGVNKIQNQQFIQWGVFPRCHKGLLFLDEIQALNKEVWHQLRTVRSTGIASVSKIAQGSRPAQVRLICAANAKEDKEMVDFKFGCQTLSTFMDPADIRRFDLGVFLSKRDHDPDLANTKNEGLPPKIPAELMRNAVLWAWSRKAEHVVFTDEVTDRILKDAKELSEKFGASSTIPLCAPADMREKIARMVAACACLHFRTEDFVSVTPTLEDVNIIKRLIIELYGHQNVAMDMESTEKRKESEVSDIEYKELKAVFSGDDGEPTRKIADILTTMSEIRMADMPMWANCKSDTVVKVMTTFTKYNLVSNGKFGGYKSTPKLIRFVKRLDKESSGDAGDLI